MFSARIAILTTFLTLLVIRQPVQPLEPVSTTVSGIKFVADAYNLYIEQRKKFNNETHQDRVLEQFYDLNQRVRNVDSQLKLVLINLREVGANVVRTLEFNNRLLQVQETLNTINSRLPSYGNLNQLSNVTILQMADGLLDPNLGVPTQLRYLQLLVSDNRATGSIDPIKLTDLMLEYYEGNDQAQCSLGKSVQLAMLEYYEKVQLIRIRAAAAVTVAYWLQAKHGGISLATESEHFDEEFRSQSVVFAEIWNSALGRADRQVWRCDPVEHRKHITYGQLSVQRGFITSERDIDEECGRSCSELAAKVDFSDPYCGLHLSMNGFPVTGCNPYRQRHLCKGQYSECQFIGRNLKLYGATDNGMHAVYVVNDESKTFGSNSNQNLPVTEVASYTRLPFNRCDQCYCLCRNASDNQFLSDWVLADYANGFVVTGIRIHKDAENSVVRLQIQEGKIERLARIQGSSVHWKPISHTLSYSERSALFTSNTMYMHKVEAPLGHVITGVRFTNHRDGVGLQIRTCSFSPTILQLCADISESATTHTSSNQRFNVANLDVPTRSRIPSKRTASSNMEILFVATGLEQDFGQNTVPFLDIQEVVSQPSIALTGIGLYHKGQPDYGGFIGAEVFTMNAQSWIERL